MTQGVTLEQASKAIDAHLTTSLMEVSLVGDFDVEEVSDRFSFWFSSSRPLR